MHADIAQPLHSTQGRFSLILHASPSIVLQKAPFFQQCGVSLVLCNLTFGGVHRVLVVFMPYGLVLPAFCVYRSDIPPLQSTVREQ